VAPDPAAVDPYALDRDGLDALVGELGEPAYRAGRCTWLVRGVDDPAEMTDLPRDLRERLRERFAPTRPELVAHTVADDGHTHKLLLRFPDGEAIETVLMLYPDRATVCISTQAGCAMGCPFCATGQAGFRRQLTAGEVVRQVVVADAALRSGVIGAEHLPDGAPDHVTNVVFMGMGEPLANLPATLATVRWLHDPEGFPVGARHHRLDRRAGPGHRQARRARPAGHPGGQPPRRDRRAARRPGAGQPQHPLAEVEQAMARYRDAPTAGSASSGA
jgi:23S rRNA (adenine2503-C2)-methyltransferase